jgi:hypothetical protein
VLVVVVVLAQPARKAVDDEDERTIRRGSFLIVLVVIVVLALPARKAIDDEDEPDQENGGIEPPNGLNKRSTSVNSKQNVQP